MSEETEITDCLHCGESTDIVVPYADMWYVSCMCGAGGPKKRTRAEAVAAWNRRVHDTKGREI